MSLAHLFDIDSAGTGTWHIGEKPDSSCQSSGSKKKYGFGLPDKHVQLVPDDFHHFDYIFAMDSHKTLVI